MRNRLTTYVHPNGELQRYQIVEAFNWNQARFVTAGFDPRSVTEIARLYRINIVPKLQQSIGLPVFFHVPPDIPLPFPIADEHEVYHDRNVAASIHLNRLAREHHIRWEGSLKADAKEIEAFLSALQNRNLLEAVVQGTNPIRFIALNEKLGFLSSHKSTCIVDTHFFLMDPTDLDSPYCVLGTPHGLALKDGVILNPPLNHRPCLLVDEHGTVSIDVVELTDLSVEIDGTKYRHGDNAVFHFRPEERFTPKTEGTDLIITEDKVVSVRKGGGSTIPMAGFILSVPASLDVADPKVVYHGLEHYAFGIQVGPPMMKDGRIITTLECPFYNAAVDEVPYPSTVYPLPFETARAARIALGNNKEGEPVLIWAEGAPKLSYTPAQDSCGASLLELAQFCEREQFQSIVNLDGGGSAQIILEGKRSLQIADRYASTNLEAERPVPYGLSIV